MAPKQRLALAEELHDLNTEDFGLDLDPEITKPMVIDDGEHPSDNLEMEVA